MKPSPSTQDTALFQRSPVLLPGHSPLRTTRSAARSSATNGEIEPAGREIHFAGRVIIFLEGDETDSIYQLVDGAIMLYKLMPDGRRQIVEMLHAGDVFGFSPAAVHECSAESLVASTCIVFKRADLARSPASCKA